ncbi:hypothetical protein TIFTF001_010666 [Ficus carica]|uniref:protein-serine/threonine phosphatase n=1 Tax=Ficus carica TaxID=3494 RepID=A0AA88DHQ8_FICCA|nr:hypothetical protein TIFTF001_010666 [Ficus carica]
MAGICCGVVREGETSASMEPSSRTLKRRKVELLTYKFIADVAVPPAVECSRKRQKLELYASTAASSTRECCKNGVQSSEAKSKDESEGSHACEALRSSRPVNLRENSASTELVENKILRLENPRFGVTSVCGRRRDMEDAVSVHPCFSQEEGSVSKGCHFFGVFDGHGCSHVAMKCRDRLHEIVKEELESDRLAPAQWKEKMERSFTRMDEEVQESNGSDRIISNCRCELQTPRCDAVGSTAVVAVLTPEKIVVSNCGDSRAVLCRNGVAIPLSSDHKPDRPDELVRIEAAGGRVIYWDGARVLGMLAMSRAIGDNYLKPYVIPEPEVTVTDRTDDDECLILASDGLWDVVSNDTACGVARMCLRAQNPPSPPRSPGSSGEVRNDAAFESSDKACSDASILLTKLALARHSTDNVSVVVVDLRRERQQQ